MSMASLEREVLHDLQVATGNQKLRMKHVMEWSTGRIKAQEGETIITLPSGINVCYVLPETKPKKEKAG